jgi:hypothetical protein
MCITTDESFAALTAPFGSVTSTFRLVTSVFRRLHRFLYSCGGVSVAPTVTVIHLKLQCSPIAYFGGLVNSLRWSSLQCARVHSDVVDYLISFLSVPIHHGLVNLRFSLYFCRLFVPSSSVTWPAI